MNASGKDTVAGVVVEKYPGLFVTTESRLLMYHLGIISGFAANYPVIQQEYKQLEDTSQDKIITVTNGLYRKSLESFNKADTITLLLSHLVFLLHIDKKPNFLDGKDPPFSELFAGLIQIKASTKSVLERRLKDNATGKRERNYPEAAMIEKHQLLCDKKWDKIIANRPVGSYITVVNEDLNTAIDEVSRFIFIL